MHPNCAQRLSAVSVSFPKLCTSCFLLDFLFPPWLPVFSLTSRYMSALLSLWPVVEGRPAVYESQRKSYSDLSSHTEGFCVFTFYISDSVFCFRAALCIVKLSLSQYRKTSQYVAKSLRLFLSNSSNCYMIVIIKVQPIFSCALRYIFKNHVNHTFTIRAIAVIFNAILISFNSDRRHKGSATFVTRELFSQNKKYQRATYASMTLL